MPFDPTGNRLPGPLAADEIKAPDKAVKPKDSAVHNRQAHSRGAKLTDFYAHLPGHNYLFIPTRELWPAASVNSCVHPWPVGENEKDIAPAAWLDKHRSIVQMAWHPAEPELVRNRVLQGSGWVRHADATVFNLYRPPVVRSGNAEQVGPWRDHVRRVYPEDANQIELWLAHRIQKPGEKLNHALVLGGAQGIGKDTLLEPIKLGIGPWNWSDINPSQMLGRFNGWTKAVIVRVNEARDLGDVDRFAFYDHSKTYITAPPDVLRVDEKNLREHYVANVLGLIITTNHKTDGLYLPADDRRHFVAWSPRSREEFDPAYWRELYAWFDNGGNEHTIAYLRSLDLSGFDPKAPPPKTAAFWAVVATGEAPESAELRDVLEKMGQPAAVTLASMICQAQQMEMHDLVGELRSIAHRLERVGYVPVRNPDAGDGMFKVHGRRVAIYANKTLSLADSVKAARQLSVQGRV